MIYFDSAATTLEKPQSVPAAAAQAMTRLASPGRGGHRPAMEAAAVTFACREAAARLFHVEDLERVVFTFNATHGLNIAIGTLAGPGSRVVISGYEHNAVTRPLHRLKVDLRVARGPLFDQAAALEGFRRELDRGADLAVCTHASPLGLRHPLPFAPMRDFKLLLAFVQGLKLNLRFLGHMRKIQLSVLITQ